MVDIELNVNVPAPAWSAGINFTGHLSRLMRDLVARVPALGHIDLGRVLVFARPGRSGSDGPNATCHCLALPESDPGYYFWRDLQTGRLTRRSEWFVERSPAVTLEGRAVDYLISFALPRFCNQTLERSAKRAWYPGDEPWVAKLDTVVHELYHIDPSAPGIRRLLGPDGQPSPRSHTPQFFADVVSMVRAYLASHPDPSVVEFLRYDFDGLTARYGGVVGLTFRGFPAYPRRYREALVPQPAPPEFWADAPTEPLPDADPIKSATGDDLQLRQFFATGSRVIVDGRVDRRRAWRRRSTDAARADEAARPVAAVQPLDPDDATRAWGVDELGVAHRDADMRRARRDRREEDKVAGAQPLAIDTRAEPELFAHLPGHLDAVAPEHVPHEPAAIEP